MKSYKIQALIRFTKITNLIRFKELRDTTGVMRFKKSIRMGEVFTFSPLSMHGKLAQ